MKQFCAVLIVLLLVSFSQAQTPKISLVWEKSIPEGVFKLALDEQDTLSPPVFTIVTLQSNTVSQKILRIDSAGTKHEILTKRPNDPVVLSPNGRFIGMNRWMYDPNFRNLPTPYVITPSGSRITLQGECVECEIAAIANSGRVILGSKGLRYSVEIGRLSTKRETLVFYDARGRSVREIPASWEMGKKLSPDGGFLVLRQWLSNDDATGRLLKLYDGDGRKLWEKDGDVGFGDEFDVSESGIVADGYFRKSDSIGGVKFYNRSGQLLGDVVLGPRIMVQRVTLDPAARYALVQSRWYSKRVKSGPGGESLFLLRVDSHDIVWRRDLPE